MASAMDVGIRKLTPSKPHATSDTPTRYSIILFRKKIQQATISNIMPAAIAVRRRNCVTCTTIGRPDRTESIRVRSSQFCIVASCQREIKLRISAGMSATGTSFEVPSDDSLTIINRSRMRITSVESVAANFASGARNSSWRLTSK